MSTDISLRLAISSHLVDRSRLSPVVCLLHNVFSYQGYLYIICVEASEMEIEAITALAREILFLYIIISFCTFAFCESVLSFSCSECFTRSWNFINLEYQLNGLTSQPFVASCLPRRAVMHMVGLKITFHITASDLAQFVSIESSACIIQECK